MQKNISEALAWRYATKKFNPSKKLSSGELSIITEAMRLAPTSYGLPVWRAIVVTNDAVRAKLRAAAWDQPQITDASHLIVIAVKRSIDAALVDAYISEIASVRGIPAEALTGFGDMMKGSLSGKSPEQLHEWASRQAYIALGFGLEAAALSGIDACPMEGFDAKQFDEILLLGDLDLASVVVMPVGHRSEADASSAYKKVRFSEAEMIRRME
jgi:nitroreductase